MIKYEQEKFENIYIRILRLNKEESCVVNLSSILSDYIELMLEGKQNKFLINMCFINDGETLTITNEEYVSKETLESNDYILKKVYAITRDGDKLYESADFNLNLLRFNSLKFAHRLLDTIEKYNGKLNDICKVKIVMDEIVTSPEGIKALVFKLK